jgi:O-antigen/teichoic acid export membrane protein
VVVPYRAVFQFSFPMITGEISFLSLSVGGVFVLGMYHSTVEVADYRAVFSAARLNTAVTTSFATLFLPMIAKLHGRGNLVGLRDTYWNTAAFVAVLTFPIFALTGPLSSATTVTLFGERYAESATILSVLAIGYYVSVLCGFNAYALQVCGRLRYLVVVNVVIAVGNIGLCLALAPRYAAVGAAAANCIAMVVQNLLNQAALRKSLNSGLVRRTCWGAYFAIAVFTATLWGFEILVSPGMMLSVAAAALASLGVLLASRRALQLADTFPELGRIPIVRWVIR